MMKAVPASATGCFFERPVANHLRDSFVCTWVHRMAEAGAPPIIVTPDGTIDLQWMDGTFRVAGPDKDPKTEIVPAGTTVIGFRFRPAAAAAWLGVPAIEMLGQRPMLGALWGARATRLAGSIGANQDIVSLIGSLESALGRCTPAGAPADAPMRAAYELIQQGPPPGAPLVPWLGRTLAMSERTLRRRFDESFGYGPKTLDRILRYRRFTQLCLRMKGTSTAMLAAEAGYSDQAHLVRESRRLTGSTPYEFDRIMAGATETNRPS
jgi:AraC-like DNA-binding protein